MANAEGRGSSFGEAFRASIHAAGGGPRKSYTAQSATAQYKHLMRTHQGRDALGQAGLGAAQQTQRRWVRGVQKPGRTNASIIHGVYAALARGRIPDSVRNGTMKITGRIGTGTDIRNRGSGGNAPLLIDLSEGDWGDVEAALNDDLVSDLDLEDIVSEKLIEPDIGGSDTWFFPGGSYTVSLSY